VKKEILIKWLSVVILIISTITYLGCEQKNEKADQPENDKGMSDTTSSSQDEPNDATVETKITFPDLKGTWTGTFDGRSSVLNILEQTDSNFSGKITINYRQVTNQEVKGTLNPTTYEFTMTDQLHSRYQGKYKGELSSNNQNFSGTFTLDNDGTKYSFNLKKK
jgi:hypothetical protein